MRLASESECRWIHLACSLQHSRMEQHKDFCPNPSLLRWFR